MIKKNYDEVAEIIRGIKKKYPTCGSAILEIERELAVIFTRTDEAFSASLFLSYCDAKDSDQ